MRGEPAIRQKQVVISLASSVEVARSPVDCYEIPDTMAEALRLAKL